MQFVGCITRITLKHKREQQTLAVKTYDNTLENNAE